MHDVIWEPLTFAVCVGACVRAGGTRERAPTPTRLAAVFLGCDWAEGGDSFCHD